MWCCEEGSNPTERTRAPKDPNPHPKSVPMALGSVLTASGSVPTALVSTSVALGSVPTASESVPVVLGSNPAALGYDPHQCLVPYILSHSRNKSSSFWDIAGCTLQNAFSRSW